MLQLPAGSLPLAADRVGVDAGLGDKLAVLALLDNAAVVEHEDLIRVVDGFQPVRDHNDGLVARQGFDGLLKPVFVFGVNIRGGFVQNDDGRVLEHCARMEMRCFSLPESDAPPPPTIVS